jgi:hypothetical protein
LVQKEITDFGGIPISLHLKKFRDHTVEKRCFGKLGSS